MVRIHLKTEQFKGQNLKVEVTVGGFFYVLDQQDCVLASGYELERVLKTAKTRVRSIKRKRIGIPFLTTDRKRAVARGRHEGTNNILVWIESPHGTKGKTEQWDYYKGRQALKPDTSDEDFNQLNAWLTRRKELQDKIDAWEAEHTFNLNQAIDEALKELDATEEI